MRRALLIVAMWASPVLAAQKPLPLIEVPAQRSAGPPAMFALMISGDGGWAKIDRAIADHLSSRGIPVVGLNALEYFWTKRTPDELGRDVTQIVATYSSRWKAAGILLIGYSRGADVLPFAVNRMPEPLRRRITMVALLSPSKTTQFEFRVTDWFKDRDGVPTRAEIEKLRGTKTICVYGTDDRETVCTDVDARIAKPVALAGSHHFDRDYDALARLVLANLTAK